MMPLYAERAAGVGSCSARKRRWMAGRGKGTRARLSIQATLMWLYIACVAVVEVRRRRRRHDAGLKGAPPRRDAFFLGNGNYRDDDRLWESTAAIFRLTERLNAGDERRVKIYSLESCSPGERTSTASSEEGRYVRWEPRLNTLAALQCYFSFARQRD